MPALDGLRGLAILLVLAHHFNLLHPAGRLELELIRLFDLGKHGVDLFFVLSGFLITGILLDSRGRPGYFRSFYARRTLRIFPLYYLMLAFLLIVLPRLLSADPATLSTGMRWASEADDWPWYFGYASNFLFGRREGFAMPGLDVTWSLAIEEQFYLLWSVMVFLLGPRRLVPACLAIAAGAPIFRAIVGFGPGSWLDAYLLTPGRLDGLAIGALLAVILRRSDLPRERLLKAAEWTAAASVAGLVILHLGAWLNGFTGPGLIVGLTLVALLSASGMVLALHAAPGSPSSRIFTSRVMGFFGKYSYAMYLLHMPIRDLMRRHWFPEAASTRLHGAPLLGLEALYLAAGVAATSLAAWLSWQLIEKRFLGLKKFFPRPGGAALVALAGLALLAGPSLARESGIPPGRPAAAADSPRLESRDPRFGALLPPDTPIELLATGHEWLEGPVWSRADSALYFSDVRSNTIYRWSDAAGVEPFLHASGTNGEAPDPPREAGANGLALDEAGRLVACRQGERCVARREPGGGWIVLADRYDGRRFNSPNDLALRAGGEIFFTDPPYGRPRGFGDPGRELDFCGLFRRAPDGAVTLLTKELEAPNGLAFSPDEKTLYVSNSWKSRPGLMAFPVAPDGRLGPGRLFFDMGPFLSDGPGLPDGLKVDLAGNLFATGPGGLYVLSPAAQLLGRIRLPLAVANCGWGGDGSALFLTASGRLYRVTTRTRGRLSP